MDEKEIAKKIYNELIVDSKSSNFIAEAIKPKFDSDYNNYDVNKLKKEAQKLGFNIFLKEELKRKIYQQEKGETIFATFKNINEL